MLGLIRYITSSFSTIDSLCLFIPPLCDSNCNKRLLLATPLQQRIRPNSKEFKENLLPCVVADSLWAYVTKIVNIY
jgi:hypothetical protein